MISFCQWGNMFLYKSPIVRSLKKAIAKAASAKILEVQKVEQSPRQSISSKSISDFLLPRKKPPPKRELFHQK